MAFMARTLVTKRNSIGVIPGIFSRSLKSATPFRTLRPLAAAAAAALTDRIPSTAYVGGLRSFCSPPPVGSSDRKDLTSKEEITLEGCDFEHWLIMVDQPQGDLSRDEIIDHYIKMAATVVGSEEEAKKKIYSVSTRHYFAFGIMMTEEVSNKFKEMKNVRWVLPDSYMDVAAKDYGGEPFINGQAVPYDPKFHEEWLKNKSKANERSNRNNRPRGQAKNSERERENTR